MKNIGLEILCGDEPVARLEQLVESIPPAADFADVVVGLGTTPEKAAPLSKWWTKWGARLTIQVGEVTRFDVARNEVHESVRSPWVLWLDADDLLVGSHNLPQIDRLIDSKPALMAWVAGYEYRRDVDGRVACNMQRERIVRVEGTTWEGAVGETLEWTDGTHERTKLIHVVHADQDRREILLKAQRNLDISEANQNGSARMRWMLARSSADLTHNVQAAFTFGELSSDGNAPVAIRYQAAIEAARALISTGDLSDAQGVVGRAIGLMPRYGEAFFVAAQIAFKTGDYDKVRYWLERGWNASTPGDDWPAPWSPTAYTSEPQRLYEEIQRCHATSR